MEIVKGPGDGTPEQNGQHPGNPGQSPLKIDWSQAEDIKCESCDGELFQEKMIIKKISKFITGQDQDSITPIPVIACAACNHVNKMFQPDFSKLGQ